MGRDFRAGAGPGLPLPGQRRKLTALHAVDLTVGPGETLGIVGESGCGKSTLAAILAGRLRPTRGRVEVLGRAVDDLPRSERRDVLREVQLVDQDPWSALDPRLTVGASVAEPLVVHRRGVRADRERRVAELLDLVGLDPHYAGRLPHQLSGGQRQRVGIARALALQPRALVLDEPVSALDVSVQAQVVNLLTRLQDELDLAFVFISHDLSVVAHVADRIAVMYLGRVVEEGAAEAVQDRPRHHYTRALQDAALEAGPSARKRRPPVVPGEAPDPADPPSGCVFRLRCPAAESACADSRPPLTAYGDHAFACHLPLSESQEPPVADPEQQRTSAP